jgi:hypothetical protein
MRITRRIGLALGIMALLTGVGCSGGGSMAPMPPASPMAPAAESAPQAQSGYGQPGGYSANSTSPAPPPPPAASAAPMMDVQNYKSSEGRAAPRQEGPADRPGLGTTWGETRNSQISTVPFQRADMGSPFATAALFYNDEEGARAMTSSSGFRRTPSGSFSIANGLVSVGLRDESSRMFGGFVSGGRNYIVGESGHRYTIVVRNNTNFRLEIVLSVDGLDVLDGKAASFGKRGYLVDPRGEVEVDGFRQSMNTVAAFRFGSVRGSYAGQKTGDTRNVGVIGVAVFNEMGTNPVPWTPGEVQQRRDANPFPGQFATPP